MPINYKNYPSNWKTKIRPAILVRANGLCEFCNLKNHTEILRGFFNGVECYQDLDGTIYNADTSLEIGRDYFGEVHETNTITKIVLTVAHLDHDTSNNDFANLKALCQRCHNRYDAKHRSGNRKAKRITKQAELHILVFGDIGEIENIKAEKEG